jgi:hypothetical protein
MLKSEQLADELDARDESESGDELRRAIVALSSAHSSAIIQHGTWMLVAGEMISSIASQLPPQMRTDIADTFRKRIERLLALGDDKVLPATYTSELMKEVNRYLKVLESDSH